MSKLDRFFRGMAMLCLGVIIGFLIAPIKKGIRISIGSGNTDSSVMNQGFDEEEDLYDEDDDEPYVYDSDDVYDDDEADSTEDDEDVVHF